MKRLLLLRHAAALSEGPDHGRGISPRGRSEAERLGNHLARTRLSLVLCSSAVRAQETLAALQSHFAWSPPTRSLRDLYLASDSELLACINELDEEEESVLVIAHNPGIAQLASALAHAGDPDDLERLRRSFPTATLAELEMDGPWHALALGRARLTAFTTPADIAGQKCE